MAKNKKAPVSLTELVRNFKAGLGDFGVQAKDSVEDAHAQIVISDYIKTADSEKVLQNLSNMNDSFIATSEKEGRFKNPSEVEFLLFGKSDSLRLCLAAFLCTDQSETDAFNLGKECADAFQKAKESINVAAR